MVFTLSFSFCALRNTKVTENLLVSALLQFNFYLFDNMMINNGWLRLFCMRRKWYGCNMYLITV